MRPFDHQDAGDVAMDHLTWVARAAILSVALAAPGLNGGYAEAADNVTLVTDFGFNGRHAYYYYALEKGYYKEAGIDLTIVRGQGSVDAVKQVAAGTAQLGFADTSAVIFGRANDSGQARGGDLCPAAACDLCSERIGHCQTEGPGRAVGRRYRLQRCSKDVCGLCQGGRYRRFQGQVDRGRQRFTTWNAVARAG